MLPTFCFFLVDDAWQGWKEWGTCSRTCGGLGSQSRRRDCNGETCDYLDEESRECGSSTPCPTTCIIGSLSHGLAIITIYLKGENKWQRWQDWSTCSLTCGGLGSQIRKRFCDLEPCHGLPGQDEESQTCGSLDPCPGRCLLGHFFSFKPSVFRPQPMASVA